MTRVSVDDKIKILYNKRRKNFALALNEVGSTYPTALDVVDFPVSDANAVFVSKANGSGTYNGTAAYPYRTLAEAVAATTAAKPYVVVADNSFYNENLAACDFSRTLGIYAASGKTPTYSSRILDYVPSDSNTVYVSVTGSDSASGTSSSPVKTLDKALSLVTASKGRILIKSDGEFRLKGQILTPNLVGIYADPRYCPTINLETIPDTVNHQFSQQVLTSEFYGSPSFLKTLCFGDYAITYSLTVGKPNSQQFKLYKLNPANISNPASVWIGNVPSDAAGTPLAMSAYVTIPEVANDGYNTVTTTHVPAMASNGKYGAFVVNQESYVSSTRKTKGSVAVILQGTSVIQQIDLGITDWDWNYYVTPNSKSPVSTHVAMCFVGNDLYFAYKNKLKRWSFTNGVLETVSNLSTGNAFRLFYDSGLKRLFYVYDVNVGPGLTTPSYRMDVFDTDTLTPVDTGINTPDGTVTPLTHYANGYFLSVQNNWTLQQNCNVKFVAYDSVARTFSLVQTVTGKTGAFGVYGYSMSVDGMHVFGVTEVANNRIYAFLNGSAVSAPAELKIHGCRIVNKGRFSYNSTFVTGSSNVLLKWVTCMDYVNTKNNVVTSPKIGVSHSILISGGCTLKATNTAGSYVENSVLSSAVEYALDVAGSGTFRLSNSDIVSSAYGFIRRTAGSGDDVRNNIFHGITSNGINSYAAMPVFNCILNCPITNVIETNCLRRNPLFVGEVVGSSLFDLRLRKYLTGYKVESPAVGAGSDGKDLGPYSELVLEGAAKWDSCTVAKPTSIPISYGYSGVSNVVMKSGDVSSYKTGQTETLTLRWSGIGDADFQNVDKIWTSPGADIRVYFSPDTYPSLYEDFILMREGMAASADDFRFTDLGKEKVELKLGRRKW